MTDPLRIRPRPAVPAVVPLVAALYCESAVGCCMHVQLDDLNCADRWFGAESRERVERCERARSHLQLFDMLAKMSYTQRLKAAKQGRAAAFSVA